MLETPVYFQKAKPVKGAVDKFAHKLATDKMNQEQGGHTDHAMSPYQARQAQEPMHGDELEAFEWIMAKMEKEAPELSYADQIDRASDLQWLYVDKKGLLRVSEERPE